jgi:hypothetical protein
MYKEAHELAHTVLARAKGVYEAHLAQACPAPGPGATDILIAHDASVRYICRARQQVRADLAAYRAERTASGTDETMVFYLTLARKLRAYERALRRSHAGRVKTFHGVTAMAVVSDADCFLTPDIVCREWRKRSGYTAHIMNLGKHLPAIALKCRQYGRTLLCVCEDFTTQGCSHCSHGEARGSALFITCSACGLATHRDAGNAPNGIAKRALVHGAEALQGLLSRRAKQGVG